MILQFLLWKFIAENHVKNNVTNKGTYKQVLDYIEVHFVIQTRFFFYYTV